MGGEMNYQNFRNFYCIVLVLFVILILEIKVNAKACNNAIQNLENKGYIYLNYQSDAVYIEVSPQTWSIFPYKSKLGLLVCAASDNPGKKIYIIRMGSALKSYSDMYGAYDSEKGPRIYR
jgi:hypothetical protein